MPGNHCIAGEQSCGSLCGFYPERLRDCSELVADLLNAGGELVRATQIDDLGCVFSEPPCSFRERSGIGDGQALKKARVHANKKYLLKILKCIFSFRQRVYSLGAFGIHRAALPR